MCSTVLSEVLGITSGPRTFSCTYAGGSTIKMAWRAFLRFMKLQLKVCKKEIAVESFLLDAIRSC